VDRKGHGRAVDWWSLGAILYEMITGIPPFYSQNRQKLFEKIRKGKVKFTEDVSPASRDILTRFLQKDPQKRLGSGPTDAEEIMIHPLFDGMDWEKLERRELPPPWRPKLVGTLDTSQFDDEFTSMPTFSPSSNPHSSSQSGPNLMHLHSNQHHHHQTNPFSSPYSTTSSSSSSSSGGRGKRNNSSDNHDPTSSNSLFDGFTYTDPNAFLGVDSSFFSTPTNSTLISSTATTPPSHNS